MSNSIHVCPECCRAGREKVNTEHVTTPQRNLNDNRENLKSVRTFLESWLSGYVSLPLYSQCTGSNTVHGVRTYDILHFARVVDAPGYSPGHQNL